MSDVQRAARIAALRSHPFLSDSDLRELAQLLMLEYDLLQDDRRRCDYKDKSRAEWAAGYGLRIVSWRGETDREMAAAQVKT